MKKILFLILILSFNGAAQDSKVTTGMLAFNQGYYEEAIQSFDIALKNPSNLKEKSLLKAYFYKGSSLFRLYSLAVTEKNDDLLNKYEFAIPDAVDLYKKCLEIDSYYFKKDIERDLIYMSPYSATLAFSNLQNGEYFKAIRFAEAGLVADDIMHDETVFAFYDIRGQAELGLKDSAAACRDFEASINLYEISKPAKPNAYIGNVYYYLGFLNFYFKRDFEKTISVLDAGIKMMEDERIRLNFLDIEGEEEKAILSDIENYETNLNALRLDVYLNSPEAYEDALVAFEEQLKANPNNEKYRVAYATLLEKSDVEAAIIQYLEVLKTDPDNYTANYNLGALYFNQGAYYAQVLNDGDRFSEWEESKRLYVEKMSRSKPYFEKVLELDPHNRSIIQVLMQICLDEEDDECYKKYKNMMD